MFDREKNDNFIWGGGGVYIFCYVYLPIIRIFNTSK